MEALAFLMIVVTAIWLQKYIFARFIFKNLDYSCSFSTAEAFEGDEICMTEIVHNNKILPLHWLKVEICSSRWLDFANTRSVIAQDTRFVTSGFHLRSYQKTTRNWKVKCLKRGVYTTGNVTLAGGDFFGILNRSMPVGVNMRLTVFPGTAPLQDILISSRGIQGDLLTKRWILDDPFIVSGASEYAPGDPLNRMHWQATARQGMLMVRKNDFTVQKDLLVMLNIQSMACEHGVTVNKEIIEHGIRIAAAIFDKTIKYGMPVGFASNGLIPGGTGRTVTTCKAAGTQHLMDLMTVLSQLELKNSVEFEDCLEDFAAAYQNSDVIIITAYLDAGLCGKISRMERQCRCVKVILLDEECKDVPLKQDMEVYLCNLKQYS